jgi:O-acetyl-ADP-ribose deacetylase (regulator of RNase III)
MSYTLTLKFFDLYPDFERELKANFKDQTTFDFTNFTLKIETITCNILDLPEYKTPSKYPNIAFVSPANSFGWMNGGIDAPLADKVLPGIDDTLQNMLNALNYRGELETGYSTEFLDKTLNTIKKLFKSDHNLATDAIKFLTQKGLTVNHDNLEDYIDSDFIKQYFPRKTPDCHLPVGSAIIVKHQAKNQFLISAPTMFFPQDVRNTRNAYFAMISILKVVEKYNTMNPQNLITEILCPGLCTGVGGLSFTKLATQLHDAIIDFHQNVPDNTTPDQNILNSFENTFPGQLYLREPAYHQYPIKAGMISYILRSMFHSNKKAMNFVEDNVLGEKLNFF